MSGVILSFNARITLATTPFRDWHPSLEGLEFILFVERSDRIAFSSHDSKAVIRITESWCQAAPSRAATHFDVMPPGTAARRAARSWN
jgi:hypothetical protein